MDRIGSLAICYEARYRRRFVIALIVSAALHALLLFGFPVPKQWGEIWNAPHIGYAGPELHLGELNPQDYKVEEVERLASARREAGALVDELVDIEPESKARERILKKIASGLEGRDALTNPVLELTEDWDLRSTSAPTSRSNDFVIHHMVRPDYPLIAIEGGVEGLVKVQAWIDKEGSVTRVEILESEVDVSCEVATKRAMLKWKFRPYLVRGEPIEFSVIVPFRFRLT